MESKTAVIALMGNPNVGKSTLFNALTGLRQHTGNWPGKTVALARGRFSCGGRDYLLADLPGIYSLDARSEEEEVASQFLRSGLADMILVVCDACCLERGLHLLKQVLELEWVQDTGVPLILCVNLWDEACRRGIHVDLELLQDVLQIPVVACSARSRRTLEGVKQAISESAGTVGSYQCLDFSPHRLAEETVHMETEHFRRLEERLDRIVTGPLQSSAALVALLLGVFWLTMAGANIPAQFLWDLLFSLEDGLAQGLTLLGTPPVLVQLLVYGVYRVLAWVVAVMLPPMAIFFPLFTLLEDSGYLPRAAFNMDRCFMRCRACGKQCLTMAMGLGCNAAGVTGCRIIDSPRERLVAILTNALVPCNGRFPVLTAMISLFFLSGVSGGFRSFLAALFLTAFLLLGVAATLCSSWLLSRTLLKGLPSSFTLELPCYRRPQVGKVLIRSLLDRTVFVLGRAAASAIPAGVLIWTAANLHLGGQSLLAWLTGALDPLGRLMGLDGVILAAFLLGFPANEIVLPIILMAYLQTGTLVEMSDLSSLYQLLTAHGWTWQTALSMMLFCLFHWPCATTCLTIKKETGSLKWTAAAIALPTLLGFLLCTAVHFLCRLLF